MPGSPVREEFMPDCLATAIYRYNGVFLILDTQDLDAKIKETRVQTHLFLVASCRPCTNFESRTN